MSRCAAPKIFINKPVSRALKQQKSMKFDMSCSFLMLKQMPIKCHFKCEPIIKGIKIKLFPQKITSLNETNITFALQF